MSWRTLPVEIWLLIFEELVRPDYDKPCRDQEKSALVEVWARHIQAGMMVCSKYERVDFPSPQLAYLELEEWHSAIQDRLLAAITPPNCLLSTMARQYRPCQWRPSSQTSANGLS